MKVAIVWANVYNKNLGVGALALSAIALLDSVFEDLNIKVEYVFFGSSKMTKDTFKIGKKVYNFDNLKGFDFGGFKGFLKKSFFKKKYQLHKLDDVNFVFDVGEGDSFSDIYGLKRFNKICNSKKYFLSKNITQILLPQTIGPFEFEDNKKIANNLLSQMRLVMARDKKSFEYCQKFVDIDKLSETVDMAFYLPFEKNNLDNGKINVGINVSGLLWNGGYTGKNQFNLKTNFKDLIIGSVDFFTKQENVNIFLVPHVIPENQPIEDDYYASLEIKKAFPNVQIAPRFNSAIEAKSFISGMDFFIGGRMHACIAAFGTNVPVVPLAYSRKFNGLFGNTLGYNYIADCVNNELNSNLEIISTCFYNRLVLKKEIGIILATEIANRINSIKQELKKMILNES